MRDLFFILKSIFLTLVLILTLQVQIDNQTLEERSLAWIRTSPFVGELQKVADAGVIGAKKIWGNVTNKFSDDVFKGFKSEYTPGQRLRAGWDRSRAYLEEKTKEAKERVEKIRDNED